MPENIYQRIEGSWFHYDIVRHVMYESLHEALAAQLWDRVHYDLVEIGAREPTTPLIRILGSLLTNLSVTAANYPDVDIQDLPYADGQWDIVIADQVLEHVERPWVGAAEIWRVTKPGGLAIVATPIMLGVHPNPLDCWRIMPDGYKVLFPESQWAWSTFGTWGNRAILYQAFDSMYARGFSGEWISFYDRDRHLPAWNTPPDGIFPVVAWWVGRKR